MHLKMSGLDAEFDAGKVVRKIDSLAEVTSQLADNDVGFYKTIDTKFAKRVDENSTLVLGLINSLIESIDETTDKIEPSIDSLNDSWKSIGNVFDGLYEKSDIAFDSMKNDKHESASGVSASRSVINSITKANSASPSSDGLTYMEDVNDVSDSKPRRRQPKPQLKFRVPIDNSEIGPFHPKLTTKPNALEPLEKSLEIVQSEDPEEPPHFKQPYEYEIDKQEYPEFILHKSDPVPSQPWPAKEEPTWVDTAAKLEEMIESLKGCKEIAVDLEHHDYRTYYGLVSLMQISNRQQDWLIDTLALRDDLTPLNEIFTDPNVVKVFHGAFMDIIWLQRDLGLYIVGLFDTYHASKQLGFPKNSLAYLLEKFANFKTNKKYQMSDWRLRPLTPSMKLYARADTHFLLNIYDQLKNMLIDKDTLNIVLHESRKVAKRRFEYYKFRPSVPSSLVVTPISDRMEPWRSIMTQYNINLVKKQLVIDLYNWRDRIARRDDESVRYIMPNQLLVALVLSAPVDSSGVLAASNYLTDHVRMNAKEIAEVIRSSLSRSESEDLELLNTASYDTNGAAGNIETGEVSERQVHQFTSNFNSLNNSLKDIFENPKNKQAPSLLSNKTSFFTPNMFIKDTSKFVWSVKFANKNNASEFTVQDVKERLSTLHGILSRDSQKPEPVQIPLIAETVSSEIKDPEQAEAEAAKRAAKENLNEIVVIRKKVQRPKTKKPKLSKQEGEGEGEQQAEEKFDYTSANKILSSDNNTKDRKHEKRGKKRKTFDPYSKDFEEPRAPKKFYNPAYGKNMSYKSK